MKRTAPASPVLLMVAIAFLGCSRQEPAPPAAPPAASPVATGSISVGSATTPASTVPPAPAAARAAAIATADGETPGVRAEVTELIDPVGRKKYFVARDSESKCVCSQKVADIPKGGRANLWAKFPAPPDDVQQISIVIPHFSPMDDVPLSR